MNTERARQFLLWGCAILCVPTVCSAQRRTTSVPPPSDNRPHLVVKSEYENPVNAVAVSPDGSSILIGGADGAARIVDLKSGRERQRLEGFAEQITRATFSPAGRFALLASNEIVYLWDLSIGQQVGSWPARTASLVPDENSILVIGMDGIARLIYARTGADVRRFKVNATETRRIIFAPRGNLALLVSDRGTAQLWDFDNDKEMQMFRGLNSPQAIAFSGDGRAIALGSTDGKVHLWDVITLREMRSFSVPDVPAFVRFTPDGQTLLITSGSGSVRRFEVQTGRLIQQFEVGAVAAIEVAPDGESFVTAGSDGLGTWDLVKGKAAEGFKADAVAVSSVAFTPDGHMLLTCRPDKNARLLDANTGKELGQLYSFRREAGAIAENNQWLVATTDGLFDGSERGWEQTLWRANNNSFDTTPVESYFSDFFYPGLLGDLLTGKRPQAMQSLVARDRRPPKVKLTLAPGQDATAAGLTARMIKVRIEVAEEPADSSRNWPGSGVRDVRLFRNGLMVKAWRGDVLKGKPYTTLEAELPIIAGENRLSAYAFNRDNVLSPTTRLTVTGAPNLKRQGTAYIIAVGINKMSNPQYNLRYAVADAQAFGEQLKREQTKLGAFGKVELITLTDEQATKANILAALRRLGGATATASPDAPALARLNRAEPEDGVFIYYAGQGFAKDARYFLVPYDMGYDGNRSALESEDLSRVIEHSISDLDLESCFADIDAGRFLLVLDTCESGQVLEAQDKRLGPTNSKGLAQVAYEKGITVLTATQGFQQAMEYSQFAHGLFTYVLVEEGLKTTAADIAPKDGKVSMLEWLEYAAARVPALQSELNKEKEKRHHPDLKIVRGDNLQRPRIFYRRETEPQSFIVAMPTQPLQKKTAQSSEPK